MTQNPFRIVSVGAHSELFPPFRFNVTYTHHKDIPQPCTCMWAYRNGTLHLKYVHRLCRHHGSLL